MRMTPEKKLGLQYSYSFLRIFAYLQDLYNVNSELGFLCSELFCSGKVCGARKNVNLQNLLIIESVCHSSPFLVCKA